MKGLTSLPFYKRKVEINVDRISPSPKRLHQCFMFFIDLWTYSFKPGESALLFAIVPGLSPKLQCAFLYNYVFIQLLRVSIERRDKRVQYLHVCTLELNDSIFLRVPLLFDFILLFFIAARIFYSSFSRLPAICSFWLILFHSFAIVLQYLAYLPQKP
jgi:hypothetical protein